MKAGNIDHIYSEIVLRSSIIDVQNRLSFIIQKNDESRIAFYLHNSRVLSNLNITNIYGEKLKYKINKSENISFIEVEVEKGSRDIMVLYKGW